MNEYINSWEGEMETLNRGMRANGLLRDFHNILRAASSFLILRSLLLCQIREQKWQQLQHRIKIEYSAERF